MDIEKESFGVIRAVRRLSVEKKQTLMVLTIFLVMLIVAQILNPAFMTPKHMDFFLRDLSLLGILAIAQTLVILSRGIDLSVGPIYFFSSSIAGALMGVTGDFLFPFVFALLLGTAFGAVNGIGTAKFRVNPIIMTLGMMIFLTGLAFIIIGPAPKGGAHPILITISTGSTYIWFSIVILFVLISKRTALGWKFHAIGSNPTATYLSGTNVQRLTILIYALSGLLSAVAGLLYLGWAKTPFIVFTVAAIGLDETIMSIAAVLIGGTLLVGGVGGFERTFMGTLIIGILFALLRMYGLGHDIRLIVEGVALITIVYAYMRFYRR